MWIIAHRKYIFIWLDGPQLPHTVKDVIGDETIENRIFFTHIKQFIFCSNTDKLHNISGDVAEIDSEEVCACESENIQYDKLDTNVKAE